MGEELARDKEQVTREVDRMCRTFWLIYAL